MTYQPPPPPYSGWPSQPPSAPPPRRRHLATVVLIVVPIMVFAGVFAGVLLFWNRDGAEQDRGQAVEGQLRMTYPTEPSAGWQLDADEVFARAAFVRPDPISNSYYRAGFIDLGDTLVTQAALMNTDRGLDLVAIDSNTGDIRWQTTLESGVESASGLDVSTAACASKTVDGLLPCVVAESVQFFDMSDGSVQRRLEAPRGAETVEVHGSDVYTLGYQVMARGTTDNLTASWQRSYTIEPDCPGSGDSQYHGVTDHIVYFGSDAGVVVADTDDGRRLIDGEPQMILEYPGQGFTGGVCTDGSRMQTVVADPEGKVLRTVDAQTGGRGPILVSPGADVPYLADDTAYDFATGQQRWVGQPGIMLNAIIGDVVFGSGPYLPHRGGGPLMAFDAATGEHLWSNDDAGSTGMSDGARAIVGHPDGVAAINLATGQADWVLTGELIHDLAQAGDGFASFDKESITFYPPTGGASVAPGRGEPADSVDSDADEGGLITKCGRVPQMRPLEYRAESGAMVVKMEVKATCPGGDIISTNRMRVTIRDDRGTICSGVFDFSKDPLTLGGEGSETTVIELTFDHGSILRHPNTLGDRSGSDPGSTTATATGSEVVDCEDEGTSVGPNSTDKPPDSTGSKISANQDGVGDCGSDAEALEALRVQVDADRPVVQSELADRWVAQLSSKQPGLVAPDVDGRVVTWTPCEILRQHLRLRLQYPEVRLVWSDEWRTFDLRGWWVTIAGVTFGDPDAANRWCDERAIPVDECYAKVVSNTRDSRGSTKYRR
ncbi:MAG: PQQ-binding-like beta-propeller repeat protein [Mycobacterium sp.]